MKTAAMAIEGCDEIIQCVRSHDMISRLCCVSSYYLSLVLFALSLDELLVDALIGGSTVLLAAIVFMVAVVVVAVVSRSRLLVIGPQFVLLLSRSGKSQSILIAGGRR